MQQKHNRNNHEPHSYSSFSIVSLVKVLKIISISISIIVMVTGVVEEEEELGNSDDMEENYDKSALRFFDYFELYLLPVYNKDDFFDTLSCNSLDHYPQNGRTRYSEQVKIDTETCGDFVRPWGGRGGRGLLRGGGGRSRGGYYGQWFAKVDVFYVLFGMWKTTTERFFLWIGGFRPSELLKVLVPLIEPLTEQQRMDVYNLGQSCQQAEDALSQEGDIIKKKDCRS
ncbi:hypothetical protein K1719_003670 [Acacia pycnantha]|nr:hypothetical protein K1719_003670 [Acacia pycnantha]